MSKHTVDSMKKIKKEADGYNCDVVVANLNQLQLDLDTDEALSLFSARRADVHNSFPIKSEERWSSKSGHTHIVLTLDTTLSVEARIALQILLGSDPTRERCALRCHLDGSQHPVLLFKPRAA